MSLIAVCFLKKTSIFNLIFCSAWLFLFQLSAHADQSITLSWNASVDPNVAGYKIYYGVASGDYTNCIDVGNVTNAAISGLAAGTTYYFAATTYDIYGNESDFSNEAIYQVPPTSGGDGTGITLTPAIQAGGQFGFNISGTAGALYVVQASTNLVDWVSIQTNTAPFTFVDYNAPGFSQRFFRTVSLTP